jgi:integrase
VALDQFMTEHVRPKLKARTSSEYQRAARLHILPRLGRYPIGEVKRTDIARLHREMRAKPYHANRTLALLSKFFNWAEKHGLRSDGSNPCRHVEKYREGRRERFLSQAELGRLGDALRQAEQDKSCSPWVIAAIRLLTFTGARRSEILTLRWEHASEEHECLMLPDSKTGGGQSLVVIGKMLGHSQPAKTARHAHLADDPVKAERCRRQAHCGGDGRQSRRVGASHLKALIARLWRSLLSVAER